MPSGHDEPEKGVRHGSDHHARADLLLRTGKRDQLQALGTRVVTDHQSAIDGAKGACFIRDKIIDRIMSEANIAITAPAERQDITENHQPLMSHRTHLAHEGRGMEIHVAHNHLIRSRQD